MTRKTYRIGIDVGGTFTDFALYHDEPRAPSDEQLRLIQLVGRTAAVVIDVASGQVRALARALADHFGARMESTDERTPAQHKES